MALEERISLPEPVLKGKVSLEEAISKRRSKRSFKVKELSLREISQILWAGQGVITQKNGFNLRTSPSAGAIYPIEISLVNKNGLYHYLPQTHTLEVLGSIDLRDKLCVSALGQGAITQAPVNIVICAIYERLEDKYPQRAVRYAQLEAGHIAQNILLEASALGLGALAVGAFVDEQVQEVLGLSQKYQPLYIIPVGYAS